MVSVDKREVDLGTNTVRERNATATIKKLEILNVAFSLHAVESVQVQYHQAALPW